MLCNARVGRRSTSIAKIRAWSIATAGIRSASTLLIARKLVEVGVPIVQASMGIVQTWDTHVDNFRAAARQPLPPLDRAVSALLDDLEVRGLLDETLVVMLGEFGRTPRICPADARRCPGPRPLAPGLSRPSSPAPAWWEAS